VSEDDDGTNCEDDTLVGVSNGNIEFTKPPALIIEGPAEENITVNQIISKTSIPANPHSNDDIISEASPSIASTYLTAGHTSGEIVPNSNGKEGSCASIECNTELENSGEGRGFSAEFNNHYESENNHTSASEVYIGKDVSTGPLERRNQDEEISFNALDIKRKQLTRDCSVAP